MAYSGKHLKLRSMGDHVIGVELEGNPKKPEPEHFRVMFPGGDVDIVRTTDNDYWVHLRVDRPQDGDDPERTDWGRIVDARVDSLKQHAHVTKLYLKQGDEFVPIEEALEDDILQGLIAHLAVRVRTSKNPKE
jgi:hypothetical protein